MTAVQGRKAVKLHFEGKMSDKADKADLLYLFHFLRYSE